LQQLAVDSNGTFAFQIPYCRGYAVFRRNAQEHMNMIWHRLTFFQFYAFLPTPIAQDLSDFPSEGSIDCFSTIFWQNHHMIRAFPPHMCLTSFIFHHGPPRPLGAFLWRTVLYYYGGNGIAFSILTGRAGGLMIIQKMMRHSSLKMITDKYFSYIPNMTHHDGSKFLAEYEKKVKKKPQRLEFFAPNLHHWPF
jgi:hypothetical protein